MNAKQLILSLVAGIVGGAVTFTGLHYLTTKNGTEITQQTFTSSTGGINSSNHLTNFNPANYLPDANFSSAAEASLASVVHITTQYNQPNYTVYDFIFGTSPSSSRSISSSGSGVIISSDGYIVTNNHVIDKSQNIEVVLNDKRSYTAKLIGTDVTTDIALLKIEGTNLPYIHYGNSDNLKVGEWVLAVGNPFNLTSTVTAGIISAKARNINILSGHYGIESFIQTDAAVNPGNSGGALVNTKGELIGINTAIASKTGSYVGYSFAIPVNIVRKIVSDIMEFGEVQRAFLGISMADIDAKLAKKLNIDKIRGVYVAKAFKGSAADLSGLKSGDIILEINNESTNSSSELMEQLSKYRPGDEVKLTINRGNNRISKKLILQNKYGKTNIIQSIEINKLGAKFEPLSENEKNSFRLRNGIRVKNIEKGVFHRNGIREGFIITSINQTPVNTGDDIKMLIEQNPGQPVIFQGIYPNGKIARYAFKINN